MNEMTTERLTAELALRLTEACCGPDQAGQSGAARPRKRILTAWTNHATTIAHKMIQPHVPAGLLQWLVRAYVGESPRAYARRAIRCMIARSVQAGTPSTLRAANAEAVGMRDGHGATTARGYAVRLVGCIERVVTESEAPSAAVTEAQS